MGATEASEALFFVTYTGHDVISLGKMGLFQHGTSAYVGEADAAAARALGFSVSGPIGGRPAVERKSAADATRAEEEARAKATPTAPEPPKPAPKPAEAKKPEPPPAPKAEEKKSEPKAEEKKAEEKPAEAKKEEAPAAAPAV
jgi:outer membrane biosynthesis protein TonB